MAAMQARANLSVFGGENRLWSNHEERWTDGVCVVLCEAMRLSVRPWSSLSNSPTLSLSPSRGWHNGVLGWNTVTK